METRELPEDDFTDVLGKAARGLGWSIEEVARRAGVSEASCESFLSGEYHEATARAFAKVLGLNADAYASLPGYVPESLALVGVKRLAMPFGSGTVNSWIFGGVDHSLVFDAGVDGELWMGGVVGHCGGLPEVLCITHAHRDHVAGMAHGIQMGVRVVSPESRAGAELAEPGSLLMCAGREVSTIDLSGHATPSLGYMLSEGGRDYMVCGDALFAGSIGRCLSPEDYQLALANLGLALARLDDEVVLLPGHGPATTVGAERKRNPFL